MRKIIFTCLLTMTTIFLSGCEKTAHENYLEGLSKAEKGEFNAAYESFSIAIALDPTITDAYYERALCGSYTNKPDQINDLSKYIEDIAPRLTTAFISRGMMKRIDKEYDSAILDFEKAITLEPGKVQSYELKIETMKEKGDSIEAVEYYNSLLPYLKSEIDKLN